MPYRLVTPVVREAPAGLGRLAQFYKLNRGVTLLIHGTDVTAAQSPTDEQVVSADYVYTGGHEYDITDVEAAILYAAGYDDLLTNLSPGGGGLYSLTYGVVY